MIFFTFQKKIFASDIDIPPAWKEEQKARERMMNAQNEQDNDDDGDEFNPGRIVYYGRAELKTSDHRYCRY